LAVISQKLPISIKVHKESEDCGLTSCEQLLLASGGGKNFSTLIYSDAPVVQFRHVPVASLDTPRACQGVEPFELEQVFRIGRRAINESNKPSLAMTDQGHLIWNQLSFLDKHDDCFDLRIADGRRQLGVAPAGRNGGELGENRQLPAGTEQPGGEIAVVHQFPLQEAGNIERRRGYVSS
jgi:hypothetical protein